MSHATRKRFVDASYVPDVRVSGYKPTRARLEAWEQKRHETASIERWFAQQRETEDPSERLQQFAELLTPLFLFLAAGFKPAAGSKVGTLHLRAWVLLYAVRPDLIDGDTLTEAGKRYGVAPTRLSYLAREFRRYMPNYVRPALHGWTEDATIENFPEQSNHITDSDSGPSPVNSS